MPIHHFRARPDLLPSLGIVVGGALWGLFWLPLRAIGDYGLQGAWPGALLYAICFVLMLPLVATRWRSLRTHWWPLFLCGLFTGAAFASYATSLLLTDVVRTILLFYLSPVWATLLGMLLLGERLTLVRVTALAFGFIGMLVVLGLGAQFPWPRNLGDWLALASGMAWAYGSLRLYKMGPVASFEQILSFIFGGLLVFAVALALGGGVFGANPGWPALWSAAPLGLLSVLYLLPMFFLTIWPASLLSPGRVGILLMSEIVVGVTSAALLSGEPFGFREMIGTLLILAAGVVEVFGRSNKKS